MSKCAPLPGERSFELSGGRLCLDLVNTVGGDRDGQPREKLERYADLVAFARQACAISGPHAERLLAAAAERPGDAGAALRDAIAVREALFRIFLAVAGRREPAREDLARLSDALGPALSHRRLEPADRCCGLAWDDPPGALDAPLWRVLASAAELLTSGADLDRVRVCGMHETHECSWVFIDGTRARTRRWCSMTECGNKAKARRHYRRVRGAEPT